VLDLLAICVVSVAGLAAVVELYTVGKENDRWIASPASSCPR
jgi:hypothetical protein